MYKAPQRRALDAFTTAVRRPPARVNDAEAWGGIAVCEWDLPWLDGFELVENDDFIVAYHSAGSRSVMASCNGPWIDKFSTPGLISVIPPGRRVNYRIDGAVCFSSIHIPRRAVGGVSGSASLVDANFRFAFQDPFAQACMEVLVNEAHGGGERDVVYVTSVMRALLLHLSRVFRSGGAPSAERPARPRIRTSGIPLDPLLAYIDANLAIPLSLDDLADQAGVSRAHFARHFRSLTGISPHRYVMMRRVERAKELLRSARLPMAQIAAEVGFSNQSHFTQVFSSLTGSTPSQFRQGS